MRDGPSRAIFAPWALFTAVGMRINHGCNKSTRAWGPEDLTGSAKSSYLQPTDSKVAPKSTKAEVLLRSEDKTQSLFDVQTWETISPLREDLVRRAFCDKRSLMPNRVTDYAADNDKSAPLYTARKSSSTSRLTTVRRACVSGIHTIQVVGNYVDWNIDVSGAFSACAMTHPPCRSERREVRGGLVPHISSVW